LPLGGSGARAREAFARRRHACPTPRSYAHGAKAAPSPADPIFLLIGAEQRRDHNEGCRCRCGLAQRVDVERVHALLDGVGERRVLDL